MKTNGLREGAKSPLTCSHDDPAFPVAFAFTGSLVSTNGVEVVGC